MGNARQRRTEQGGRASARRAEPRARASSASAARAAWPCAALSLLCAAAAWAAWPHAVLAMAVASGRQRLDHGEVRVVDSFLSPEEVAFFRSVLDSFGAWDEQDGESLRQEPNGAPSKKCDAYDIRFGTAGLKLCREPARSRVLDVAERAAAYANQHIAVANSHLTGSYVFSGRVHVDSVALRRYYPSAGPGTTRSPTPDKVNLHNDADVDGRCLSAAIYLSSSATGRLQTFRCPPGHEDLCSSLAGPRMREVFPKHGRNLTDPSFMVLAEEVQPAPGRLVFFLSDTVHGVTTMDDGRDVIFSWLNCHHAPLNHNWFTGRPIA